MSLPETCPFCSEPKVKTDDQGDIDYRCGSWASTERGSFQSHGCKDAERARLAARVAELDARCKRLEEAGDNLETSIACGCGVDGPCQMCRRALDSWQQAKDAKP